MEVMERKEIVATLSYDAAEQLQASLARAIKEVSYDKQSRRYDDICIILPPCKLDVKTLKW